MSKFDITAGAYGEPGRSYRSYILGFGLGLVCTMMAYAIVMHHWSNRWIAVWMLVVLAAVQVIVQLFLFLHLGQEGRPRWRLFVLVFMVMVVLILVGGSIWIMYNLNYRMSTYPTPQQINAYMSNQDGGL